MSRWIEVLTRESSLRDSQHPITGIYRADWEKGIKALRSIDKQNWVKSTEFHNLVSADIFGFDSGKQALWIENLASTRREYFGLADPNLKLTQPSQTRVSWLRINENMEALKNETENSLRWILIWDAAVEGMRLQKELGPGEPDPWKKVLNDAAFEIERGNYENIVSIENQTEISQWLNRVSKEVSASKDSLSQAPLVWFLLAREGIESLIVLFCIMAGLSVALRKKIFFGAGTATLISFAGFFILQNIITRDPTANWIRYFVLFNVIFSLSVLLVATNFNFHRYYWSAWISKLRMNNWGAKALFFAGFFAIFREGVELSLALSLIRLDGGGESMSWAFLTVLPLWIGLALALFVLDKKLPLRKILVVSGAFMLLVTVVFAGFAARLLQAFEWISTTPMVPRSSIPPWIEDVFAFNGTLESIVLMLIVAGIIGFPAIGIALLKVRAPKNVSS